MTSEISRVVVCIVFFVTLLVFTIFNMIGNNDRFDVVFLFFIGFATIRCLYFLIKD